MEGRGDVFASDTFGELVFNFFSVATFSALHTVQGRNLSQAEPPGPSFFHLFWAKFIGETAANSSSLQAGNQSRAEDFSQSEEDPSDDDDDPDQWEPVNDDSEWNNLQLSNSNQSERVYSILDSG